MSTDEEELIINLIPPPELHLLLGVVNTLYSYLLKKFAEIALEWARRCNISREIVYGVPSFVGNSCKILLDKTDILRHLCTSTGSFEAIEYVRCFEEFKKVVDSCFSSKLDANFTEHIDSFRASYLSLDLSVTPKVHAVFHHVKQFCSKFNVPLGPFGEQAGESIHAHFKETWNKYNVKKTNERYPERLLAAVREYNSRHL